MGAAQGSRDEEDKGGADDREGGGQRDEGGDQGRAGEGVGEKGTGSRRNSSLALARRIRFFSKNVQSLGSPERLAELLEELKEVDWDAVLITETWRPEREEVLKVDGGHLLICSGGTAGQRGVAILLHKRWGGAFEGHGAVSERVCWASVNMGGRRLRLVATYLPHAGYSVREVEGVYKELSKIRGEARKCGQTVIVGNALERHTPTAFRWHIVASTYLRTYSMLVLCAACFIEPANDNQT